jgi:hypothetical protein
MKIAPDRPDRVIEACPHCGRLLRVPTEFLGKRVQCKFCSKELVISPEGIAGETEGLRFAGTGVAFEIFRSWSGAPNEEKRTTILRHPSKRSLKNFTLAVECFGPGKLNVGGLKVENAEPIALSRVKAGEIRVIPLDDVYHTYLWVERGEKVTARVIVARQA